MLLGLVVAASARGDGEEDMASPSARAESSPQASPMAKEGVASWYGGKFHGRMTACGEAFDENALTAAHRSLPFGTCIAVTNLDNGCQVTLRITDRGPYHGTRILDLSRAAAEHLGFLDEGLARVRFEVVGPPPPSPGLRLGLGPVTDAPPRPLRWQQPLPLPGARAPTPMVMEIVP
jgi:rare lipoprotein A